VPGARWAAQWVVDSKGLQTPHGRHGLKGPSSLRRMTGCCFLCALPCARHALMCPPPMCVPRFQWCRARTARRARTAVATQPPAVPRARAPSRPGPRAAPAPSPPRAARARQGAPAVSLGACLRCCLTAGAHGWCLWVGISSWPRSVAGRLHCIQPARAAAALSCHSAGASPPRGGPLPFPTSDALLPLSDFPVKQQAAQMSFVLGTGCSLQVVADVVAQAKTTFGGQDGVEPGSVDVIGSCSPVRAAKTLVLIGARCNPA
jgi:hypothetical protein